MKRHVTQPLENEEYGDYEEEFIAYKYFLSKSIDYSIRGFMYHFYIVIGSTIPEIFETT